MLIFHKKTPLPAVPRIDEAWFVIDNNFYVVGGIDSANVLYSEVWRYNTNADSWQRMHDFPDAIFSSGSFVLNRKGYVTCGIDTVSGSAFTNKMWEYDHANDLWLQKANFPGPIRQVPSCFSYGTKGYLGLGNSVRGNDLWEYDQANDHWTEKDSLPGPGRYGSAVTVIDSFAYFIGGYDVPSGYSNKEVWRYRILSSRWEQLDDMPGVSRGFSPIWNYENIIVTGLGNLNSSTDFKLLSDRYTYNIVDSTWRSVVFQGFVDSTADGISFMIENTGYYFGGAKRVRPDFSYYNDMWSFDATPLLITGVQDAKAENKLIVYPNPLSSKANLTISSPDIGEISFYNSIGQVLYTTSIHSGNNTLSSDLLHVDEGLIFYTAQFRSGDTEKGKVVIVK